MGNQKATRLKKKKGPGVDFKRVKSKVGKKLPRADNATRTDFKAKALQLPGQSVGASKGALVTSRNLSLQDLLSQASHYNAASRKDSLLGLQELLQHHPALLSLHTAAIVEKIAPRIADGDRNVREALLSLLSKTVLPSLPEALFASFFPILVAHVCNGLTHMAAEVRLSAVAFLDLLVTHYPALLHRSPAYTQIEDHFVTLLSMTGPFGRTPSSLLKVLSSLHRFLEASQSPLNQQTLSKSSQPEADTWKWQQPRASSLHLHRSTVEPRSERDWLRGGKTQDDSSQASPHLAERLVARLLDCWVECTPAALAVKPDAITTQCLVKIVRIIHLLSETIHTREPFLPDLVQKIVPHFPATLPGVRVSAREIEELVDLNLAVCQLMLPFFGGPESPPWKEKLVEYLQRVLEGRVLAGSGQGLAKGLEKRALTEEQTRVVLTSLEAVLQVAESEEREGLLAAFTGFYLGCGPQSRAKAAALSFMGRLLQDASTVSLVPPSVIERWLASLPRLLWELRASSPPTSHQVLLLLLRCAQMGGKDFASLQPSLLPFFCLTLPPKTGKDAETRKFGPFTKLPQETQNLAVDLLPYLGALSPPLVAALAHCCLAPGVSTPVVLRCLQVLHHCACAADTLRPADYLSFLLTLLVKGSSHATAESETPSQSKAALEESEALLNAVCTGLARVGDGRGVMSLMGPSLASLLKDARSRGDLRTIYALLRATGTCLERGHLLAYVLKDLADELPSAILDYLLEATIQDTRQDRESFGSMRPCVLILKQEPLLMGYLVENIARALRATQIVGASSEELEAHAKRRGAILTLLLRLTNTEDLHPLLIEKHLGDFSAMARILKAVEESSEKTGSFKLSAGSREALVRLEARLEVLFGQQWNRRS